MAFDRVTFQLEDVLVDRSLTCATVKEMWPQGPTKLRVQDGTEIDLTTSGSMLVSGKTRSGKTTGIIALLLQVLLCGRDEFGSEVIIVDPKQAELSRLPQVVTLDEDGEARGILQALKQFASAIVTRQPHLKRPIGADRRCRQVVGRRYASVIPFFGRVCSVAVTHSGESGER